MMVLPAVLTIAGSDSIGGAGIQADLKTMLANGVYGMSAVTALTAQNTTGVTAVMNATPEFLGQEIDAVFSDISPAAVKVGMVSSAVLISVIAERLARYEAKNVVVDPVMVATSGAHLIDDDAISSLEEKLFPLATVITPNMPELAVIAGVNEDELRDAAARERVAHDVSRRYGCAVLAKGGHDARNADDTLVMTDGRIVSYKGERIETKNTHGTGCTLSSAIASNLAKGMALDVAVERAKAYVTGALSAGLDMGRGCGPMHHGFDVKSEFV